MKEGMGKRFSQKDIASDFEDQQTEARWQDYTAWRQVVVESGIEFDKCKALTGRKENDYERESAVCLDELFPEGGSVLNIGDPWQTLDRKGVVNLEYETGEMADFTFTDEQFEKKIEQNINKFYSLIDEKDEDLRWRMNALEQFVESTTVLTPDDYRKQAGLVRDMINIVVQKRTEKPDSDNLRDLWYALEYIARAYEDQGYMKSVIWPEIEKRELKEGGLSEDEKFDIVQKFMFKFRGGKKYKQADLVFGAFPNTDFEDGEFDRIVASWSISVHMFENMKVNDFNATWEELDRLLKKDGAAYFWPMYWHSGNREEMTDSLIDYIKSGGTVISINNILEYKVFSPSRGTKDLQNVLKHSERLVVLKRGASEKVVNRILDSIVHFNDAKKAAA